MKAFGTILLLALLQPLWAATVVVPTDQPTIQAGIDAALDGDTVLILPDTYTGPGNREIAINGREIVVRGGGEPWETIIDVENEPYDAIRLDSTYEDSSTIIEYLTIKRAQNGIVLIESAPRLSHLVIDSCSDNGVDVTLFPYPSGPAWIVEYCNISNNGHTGIAFLGHDEIAVHRISSSTFTNNYHAGISVDDGTWHINFVIDNCHFTGGEHGIYLWIILPNILCRNSYFDSCSAFAVNSPREQVDMRGLVVDSCEFEACYGGVYGNFTLSNSTFSGGSYGTDGRASLHGDWQNISNCEFRGITDQVLGEVTDLEVTDCKIVSNPGTIASCSALSPHLTFDGCVIDSNTGGMVVDAAMGEAAHFTMTGTKYRHNGGSIDIAGDHLSSTYVIGAIENCEFVGNESDVIRLLQGWSFVDVINCLFDSNGGSDIAILAGSTWDARLAVSGTQFLRNMSEAAVKIGTGTEDHPGWSWPMTATFTNCSIVDCNGSAVKLLYGRGQTLIQQSILAFNEGFGIELDSVAMTDDDTLTLACNDVFGNLPGNYSGLPDPTGADGNISLDPLFCDADAGDYYLQGESPCAPANNSCGVLIGALPVGCAFECGDFNGDSMQNISDAVYLLMYIFGQGPAPLDESGGNVNCDSKINLTDIVYLIYYIFCNGPAPCEGCG